MIPMPPWSVTPICPSWPPTTADFDAYERAVRAEYAMLPTAQFNAGRAGSWPTSPVGGRSTSRRRGSPGSPGPAPTWPAPLPAWRPDILLAHGLASPMCLLFNHSMRGPLLIRCRPFRHPGELAVYYVRLPSGDEKTYRTVEEMVWDVELGVINREAMIFHPATKAWVQVTRHPQLGSRFVSEDGSADEIGLDFDLLSDDEIKGMEPKVPEQLAHRPMADLVINTDIAIDAAEQMAAAPEVKPAEGLAIAGEFLTLKEPIPSLLRCPISPRRHPPTRPPLPPRPPGVHRFPRPRRTCPSPCRSTVSSPRCRRTDSTRRSTSRSSGSRSRVSAGWS